MLFDLETVPNLFYTKRQEIIFIDNDFEIESKYHRKICCLVVLAHIFSSQDVVFRRMFFLIFGGFTIGFCERYCRHAYK